MATKLGDITLAKQEGTILTLATEGTYVSDNVYFSIAAPTGAATVTVASTDASISDDSVNRNIASVIGVKSTDAPQSGYYIKVDASGTGSSTVTTAGWLATGSLGTASASNAFYFPVQAATASASGSNVVTPSASVSGSNVTLSNVNNGISITATGGGSAAASFTTTTTQAGYMPNNIAVASGTANASNTTTTASSYISGVTIPIPSSGTNTFSVTIPNGANDTVTLTFTVDSSGNTSIE